MHHNILLMGTLKQKFSLELKGNDTCPISYVNPAIFHLNSLFALGASNLSFPLFATDSIRLPSLNYLVSINTPDTTIPYSFEHSDSLIEFNFQTSTLREISSCVLTGKFLESFSIGYPPIERIRHDCELRREKPLFLSINTQFLTVNEIRLLKNISRPDSQFSTGDTILPEDPIWEYDQNNSHNDFGNH